jgi:hypothetical protein
MCLSVSQPLSPPEKLCNLNIQRRWNFSYLLRVKMCNGELVEGLSVETLSRVSKYSIALSLWQCEGLYTIYLYVYYTCNIYKPRIYRLIEKNSCPIISSFWNKTCVQICLSVVNCIIHKKGHLCIRGILDVVRRENLAAKTNFNA